MKSPPQKIITGTHPKFNSSPLKNDGWKTSLSFWDGNFSGANFKLPGGKPTGLGETKDEPRSS